MKMQNQIGTKQHDGVRGRIGLFMGCAWVLGGFFLTIVANSVEGVTFELLALMRLSVVAVVLFSGWSFFRWIFWRNRRQGTRSLLSALSVIFFVAATNSVSWWMAHEGLSRIDIHRGALLEIYYENESAFEELGRRLEEDLPFETDIPPSELPVEYLAVFSEVGIQSPFVMASAGTEYLHLPIVRYEPTLSEQILKGFVYSTTSVSSRKDEYGMVEYEHVAGNWYLWHAEG